MVRSKFSVLVALAYALAIAAALLFPKTIGHVQSSENPFVDVLYKILFISGPIEVVGNFFLFVPVLLALVHAAPEVRVRYIALLCCLGSATVEIAQSWIPGRVSSLSDFISNTLGVVAIIAVMNKFPRLTHWVKGI